MLFRSLARMGKLVTKDGVRTTIEVPEDKLREVIGHLLGSEGIGDLAIEDPPLEDVMRKMFKTHEKENGSRAD